MLCRTETRLHQDSVVPDIIRYLSNAQNDSETEKLVMELNAEGRLLFGSTFRLRFDQTIKSQDFRNRIFLTI